MTRNTRGGVGGVGQKMRAAADDRRTAVVAAVGARRQQPVEDTVRCCREEADGGVLQVTSTPFSVSLSLTSRWGETADRSCVSCS